MSIARDLALQATSDCRVASAVRRYDTSPMNVVPHAHHLAVLSKAIGRLPSRTQTRSDIVANSQQQDRSSKTSRGGAPYRSLNLSFKFANLSTKAFSDTQPLCVSAFGDKVSLVTLKLVVKNDL